MLITHSDKISPFTWQQKEVCWQIPKELGRGKISKVCLRPGLELCLAKCILTKELMFQYRKNLPLLLFTYNLLGGYRVRFDDQKTDKKYEGKHLGEYYHGKYGSTWHLLPSLPNQFVSIAFYQEFITDCKKNSLETPEIVEKYLNGEENTSISHITEIPPFSNETIHEILTCQYTGVTKKIFLESKCLFLIADLLEHKNRHYN